MCLKHCNGSLRSLFYPVNDQFDRGTLMLWVWVSKTAGVMVPSRLTDSFILQYFSSNNLRWVGSARFQDIRDIRRDDSRLCLSWTGWSSASEILSAWRTLTDALRR